MQIALVLLFSFSSAFAAGERNRFDPVQLSTGNFHGCPAEGQGSDPYLNTLKKPRQVAYDGASLYCEQTIREDAHTP
jgi:hypothetical protein